MDLVTPGIGLIIWMTIAFTIVLYLLSKYAWKPILSTLKDRENSIDEALHTAEKAREEMKTLIAHNEELLDQAREERDIILKEARVARDQIIEEAKGKATIEANRILDVARENIHFEKLAAVTELKNSIAILSIEIAEKIVSQELSMNAVQQEIIDKKLAQIKFN